jgi:hypothetical protein
MSETNAVATGRNDPEIGNFPQGVAGSDRRYFLRNYNYQDTKYQKCHGYEDHKGKAPRLTRYNGRVRVHANLHKSMYSVLVKVGKRWLVSAHTEAIWLYDCKLRVQKSGWEKAREHGEKTVHAYVEGKVAWTPYQYTHGPALMDLPSRFWSWGAYHKVRYNPKLATGPWFSFVPGLYWGSERFDVPMLEADEMLLTTTRDLSAVGGYGYSMTARSFPTHYGSPPVGTDFSPVGTDERRQEVMAMIERSDLTRFRKEQLKDRVEGKQPQ